MDGTATLPQAPPPQKDQCVTHNVAKYVAFFMTELTRIRDHCVSNRFVEFYGGIYCGMVATYVRLIGRSTQLEVKLPESGAVADMEGIHEFVAVAPMEGTLQEFVVVIVELAERMIHSTRTNDTQHNERNERYYMILHKCLNEKKLTCSLRQTVQKQTGIKEKPPLLEIDLKKFSAFTDAEYEQAAKRWQLQNPTRMEPKRPRLH